MAVIWVKEEWRSRNASGGGALKQKAVRSWLIGTNDKSDGPGDVYIGAAASLPAQFDSHPELPQATAREISIQNLEESPYVWRVSVTYSSEPLTKQEVEEHNETDPLSRPPRISVEFENFEVPIFEDRDGEPILNSAHDPYLDPILWPATRKRYHVTFNAATIPEWHDDLEGKVNEANVTVVKGGTARAYPPDTLLYLPGGISDLKEEDGTTYMEISFSLLHKRQGWKLRLLDNGYQYLEGSTKRVIMVEDDGGNPVRPSDPQPLDGSGGILDDPSPANAVFNEHHVAEEADFSVLPLNDS